ncbi:hypothetical protein [Haloferula sp.]|uniref:hypothetical protein n=1 Tax=Haloferula sp. TaxID=2497595 RepID=UPI003C7596CE
MIDEPTLEFMAIRLQKKGRPQFIANWSLKTILFCLGSFAKDGTQGSGLRLNHPRARRMANDWLSAGSIPPAPPLLVAIGQGSTFTPHPAHPESGFGTLKLPLSKFIDVCDGIHRIAALRQLDLPSKSLTESEWPVEYIECSDLEDAGCLIDNLRKESKRKPQQKTPKTGSE